MDKLIFIFFLNFFASLCYRLEPLQTWNARKLLYEQNFYNFTNKLSIGFNNHKGYFCIASKNISKNDTVFEIPRNLALSVFDKFPFKSTFLKVVQSNDKIVNNNLTSNILLTLRLMQDLKSNITMNFITFKKNLKEIDPELDFPSEFENYKQYLRDISHFSLRFLNNLPFTTGLNQFSWNDEDINEYQKTGFFPVFKKELGTIYEAIIQNIASLNSKFSLFTQYWLNTQNINIFMSIYSVVSSRTFRAELNDFGITEKGNNYKDNLIINKTGGTTLIPFIDLCNHYHPRDNVGEISNNSKSYEIKRLKIIYEDEKINILSLNNYKSNEEFDFTYSNIFTNDFLLLNYGFFVKNNPFQEYVFKFEMSDPNKSFYQRLKKVNLTEHTLFITQSNKLVMHIKLNKYKLSDDLIKFITSYITYQNSLEKSKTLSEKEMLVKIYSLYINTLDRNINEFISFRNLSNVISDTLNENHNKIKKLTEIIEKNSKNSTDELQNLLYYKTLHSYLKKNLIFKFNLDNLNILVAQKSVSLNYLVRLMSNDVRKFKKRYVN
jgi:hypothetical protein